MGQPNVALVVLDTLRKDAFDRHFDWLPGRRFEDAWAPSHWTVPVHASLFTGRYPSELGVHSKSKGLDCDRAVLAERLSASGYTTRGFTSNLNISRRNDFDRGFDEFDGSWRLTAVDPDVDLFDWGRFVARTAGDGPGRYLKAVWGCVADDCDTLASLRFGATLKLRNFGVGPHADDGAAETLDYVRDAEVAPSGEFLFLNLMEAHAPYAPPREYRTVEPQGLNGLKWTAGDPEEDPEAMRAAYGDSVRYLSDVYRDIFAELSADYDYVVTLSDHGEVFGEHGAWGHSYGIYPELVHVPLAMWGEDVEDGTDETTVSLLDVHRTVLDAAGLDGDSRGRSLLDDPAGREYLTEHHGLDALQRDLLENAGLGDAVEYMDRRYEGLVAPGYYGWETEDGWSERGAPPADPSGRLAGLREDVPWRDVTEQREEVADGVRAHLEELGYA